MHSSVPDLPAEAEQGAQMMLREASLISFHGNGELSDCSVCTDCPSQFLGLAASILHHFCVR